MASHEAFADASAFLELERGFPEPIDGVEAALQAAARPAQPPQLSMRINQASLDRIAGAAQKKGLVTFGEFREEAQFAMDEVRKAQVDIFEEHMNLDILTELKPKEERVEYNFSDKDFLDNFQRAHLAKETRMTKITEDLEKLSEKLAKLNTSIGTESSIPSDPIEIAPTAPKLSLKAIGARLIEKQRIERATRTARLHQMVGDAVLHDHIVHGAHTHANLSEVSRSSTPQSTGGSTVVSPSGGSNDERRLTEEPPAL